MQKRKHSKSTLAEGVSLLLWLGLIVIVVGCFQIFFFRAMWTDYLPFALAFVAAEIAVALIVVYIAIGKIRRNETFVCILDDELLECVCSVPERGESFKVRLEDIIRVEQQTADGIRRWYLHDRGGNRYWLTEAYHNPADKFVEHIRQIKSELR